MASSRRAHQVLSNGLPSVESGLPPLHTNQTSVNHHQNKGEGATSIPHGLSPQEGATSPRGAHLPRPTCSYLKRYGINQLPIKNILSLLTTWLTLPLSLLQFCPPLFFFYFDLADFIELKCPFLGFVDRWVSTEVNSFHGDYLCRRQQGSTWCF